MPTGQPNLDSPSRRLWIFLHSHYITNCHRAQTWTHRQSFPMTSELVPFDMPRVSGKKKQVWACPILQFSLPLRTGTYHWFPTLNQFLIFEKFILVAPPPPEEALIRQPFKRGSWESEQFPQVSSMLLLHDLYKEDPLFECPCFPVSFRVTLSGYP